MHHRTCKDEALCEVVQASLPAWRAEGEQLMVWFGSDTGLFMGTARHGRQGREPDVLFMLSANASRKIRDKIRDTKFGTEHSNFCNVTITMEAMKYFLMRHHAKIECSVPFFPFFCPLF